MKNNVGLLWGIEQELILNAIKDRLCFALILVLPNFYKTFGIECDTLGIENGAILI